MTRIQLIFLVFISFCSAIFSTAAMASEPFEIKDIRVEGIQRTEPGTIFNYLPVKVGDTMTDERATQAIKSLYSTGFFKDVRIESDNGVLVVLVQERPAIAQIDFDGNKSFATDKMKEGLKQVGLTEGQIFDPSMLARAEQEIKRQYLSQGKYGASVKASSKPLERNRVALNFTIEEGAVSKIRSINIVGNTAFKESELLDLLTLTTPGWITWWNKNDQYSKQKLAADIETIRSFYMNQGYLEFNVDSTQISLTPEKKDVYITINITEGEKYAISAIKFGGDMQITEAEARNLVSIKAGDVFNRQQITESTKALNDRLANDGYAFSNVNPVPEIDKANHTAAFNFLIDPGRRVYVRRINISGNARTKDVVVRREMRQLESSWFNAGKIDNSKKRLERLQYFSEVNVETPAVPGTSDQVDVNVSVTEQSTGSVQFGAGLSSNEGIVFGVTVNQANFLGTGNRVSAQVNTGSVNTTYSLSFTDPYFTQDGVSRGFDIYRRDVDTGSLSTGSYASSSYGAGVRFGYPLNERDFISAGLTADYTKIDLSSSSPKQYLDFCGNRTGCANSSLLLNAGWTHDTRDNTLFPSNGVIQRLSLEATVPGLDLEYYKFDYKHAWYKEIFKNVTFAASGELGYGASYGKKNYPFFKNFYAGGVGSVRGYDTSSIGPRDIDPVSNRDFPVGGTKLVLTNAELFVPVPGLKDSKQFRLSAFIDGGSVFGPADSVKLNDLRFSTGVGVSWFSPFGPIKVFLATPLNSKTGDQTQKFGFQLGSQF